MAGLNIYSNQNSEIQAKMRNEFEKSAYKLASKNGGNTSQAAMVIIDHKTGYVTGCVGGLGEKLEPRSLNRATQSIRQTGSAIKPIAVLAPAINKRIITAASIFDDTERDFEKGYHPTDYSSALGKITVRRAVESSQNIPFVEIMEKLKPSKSIKYLEKMGITTLTKEDNNLVLALGGLQDGISPLEMAGAYSTISNDGVYIEPAFYNKIEKKNGTLVVKPKQKTRRVFSKEVAYILKQLLTEPVLGENGTATYCTIPGMDVGAKTGTTDENYDRWLCGFTPYYTAVTWYGYDQNESIDYNDRNPAGLIWANVMRSVHTNLANAKFEKPNSIVTVTICSETGLKANSGCTNTYEEYFLAFSTPGKCTIHGGTALKNNKNSNTITKQTTTNNTENNKQEENKTTNLSNNYSATNINSSQNTTSTNTNKSTTTNSNINNTKTNSTSTQMKPTNSNISNSSVSNTTVSTNSISTSTDTP